MMIMMIMVMVTMVMVTMMMVMIKMKMKNMMPNIIVSITTVDVILLNCYSCSCCFSVLHPKTLPRNIVRICPTPSDAPVATLRMSPGFRYNDSDS